MGHRGEYVSCTKVVTAGLKFSPLRNSQDKGHHPQVHREYILDRRDIIQSVSQHLLASLLHLISFWYSWETLHKPPDKKILATSGATEQ
jgi:hypothetical protein